jgi:hypothetical protein
MCSGRSDQLVLAGFPHSEISGSRVVCTSPELIAAYHVLHRLHAPRHPPCALSSLTIKFAHRKLDQHIVFLRLALLMRSKSSLEDPKHIEEFSYWEYCLFDYQRTLKLLIQSSSFCFKDEPFKYNLKHGPVSRSALGADFVTSRSVEVRGLEPLTPWLQTMCSAS